MVHHEQSKLQCIWAGSLLCPKLSSLEIKPKLPGSEFDVDAFEVKCHFSLHGRDQWSGWKAKHAQHAARVWDQGKCKALGVDKNSDPHCLCVKLNILDISTNKVFKNTESKEGLTDCNAQGPRKEMEAI